jgi:hypothetical protein
MRQTAAKFMPRLQTDYQKQRQLETSKELMEQVRNDPDILSKVVTVDENWIYGYNHEMKQQSSQKEASTCNSPEESAASEKQHEVGADYFFDTDAIIHKDFVLPGQTINVKFDCSVLRWLREGMTWRWLYKWCTNTWVCHHDNVPAHTTLTVQ